MISNHTYRVLLATVALSTCFFLKAVAAQNNAPAHPEGPHMEFVYEETVSLGTTLHPGATPFGERNIVPITGGTFTGPRLKGKILPGGWDWQLSANACFLISANYMIQTDDGVIINVDNRGRVCSKPGAKPAPIFTTPVFEATLGAYDWLNGGAYVGTIEGTAVDGKPAVHIRFFRASE